MGRRLLLVLAAILSSVSLARATVPVHIDNFRYGYSSATDTSSTTSSGAFAEDFTANNWSKGTDGTGTSQRWYIRSNAVAPLNAMTSQWAITFDLKYRKAVTVEIEKASFLIGSSNTRRLYQRMGIGYINNKGKAVSCYVGDAGASLSALSTPIVLSDVEGLSSVTIFGYVEAISSAGVNTASSSTANYHQFFRAGSTTASPQFQVHVVSTANGPMEPFGVCTHMDERSHYDDAAAAGVQWIRIDTSWYHVESAGEEIWDFDKMDTAIAMAKAQSLKILGIIGYGTSWATSSGDPTVYKGYAPLEIYDEAYATYVETLAQRYEGIVDAWELQNEVDVRPTFLAGTGSWAANHYPTASSDMLKELEYQHIVSLAIPKLAPLDAIVTTSGFGGGGSNYVDGFMEDMLDLNADFYDVFDVYNCHGYSLTTINKHLVTFGSIQSAAGTNMDLWLTETGIKILYDSGDARPDNVVKAYLLKAYATALAGGASKVFWFRLVNSGTYSAFIADGKRTAVFDAYKLLATEWANPLGIEAWSDGAGLTGAVAERADGSRVAVLWATGSNVALSTIITSEMSAVDLDGNAIAGSYAVTADYPVIVRLRQANSVSTVSGKVTLANYSSAKVAGNTVTFEIYQSNMLVDTQTVSLASDGSYSLTVPVKGSVSIYAKCGHWLRRLQSAAAPGTINFSLVNGDINGDNNVNVLDYTILKNNYNRTNVGSDPSDLNGDGNINVLDYTILKNNYNKVGD